MDNFEGRPGPFAVSRHFTQIRPKRLTPNRTLNNTTAKEKQLSVQI